MKKARWWIFAAVHGDCCEKPHVKDTVIIGGSMSQAMDRFQKRLERKGFEVGEIFVMQRSMQIVKWLGDYAKK